MLDTSQSFSVSVWTRLTTSSGNRGVLSQDGTHRSSFYLQYLASSDTFRWSFPVADSVERPAYVTVDSLSTVTQGEWVHLAGVYDKSAGQIRLYVNGVLQGSATTIGTCSRAVGGAWCGHTWWMIFSIGTTVFARISRAARTTRCRAPGGVTGFAALDLQWAENAERHRRAATVVVAGGRRGYACRLRDADHPVPMRNDRPSDQTAVGRSGRGHGRGRRYEDSPMCTPHPG